MKTKRLNLDKGCVVDLAELQRRATKRLEEAAQARAKAFADCDARQSKLFWQASSQAMAWTVVNEVLAIEGDAMWQEDFFRIRDLCEEARRQRERGQS